MTDNTWDRLRAPWWMRLLPWKFQARRLMRQVDQIERRYAAENGWTRAEARAYVRTLMRAAFDGIERT